MSAIPCDGCDNAQHGACLPSVAEREAARRGCLHFEPARPWAELTPRRRYVWTRDGWTVAA